jgi:hypothetical protein
VATATRTKPVEFDGPVILDTVNDARTEILLNRYRERFGLNRGPVPVDGSIWLGLFYNKRLAIAVNVRMISPYLLEVMNVCPVKGRFGVLATYAALKMLRAMVDNPTEVKGLICHVLAANTEFINALAKVFEKEKLAPIRHSSLYALVFVYGVV